MKDVNKHVQCLRFPARSKNVIPTEAYNKNHILEPGLLQQTKWANKLTNLRVHQLTKPKTLQRLILLYLYSSTTSPVLKYIDTVCNVLLLILILLVCHRMISDVQLAVFVNILGVSLFLMVVLYHYIAANNPKSHQPRQKGKKGAGKGNGCKEGEVIQVSIKAGRHIRGIYESELVIGSDFLFSRVCV